MAESNKTRFKTHRLHNKTLAKSLKAENNVLKEQLLLTQYQIGVARDECERAKTEIDKILTINHKISLTEQNKMLNRVTWQLGYLESILVIKDTKMSVLSFKESLEDKNWHFDPDLGPTGPIGDPIFIDITNEGVPQFTIDCNNSTITQTPQVVGNPLDVAMMELVHTVESPTGSADMSETDIEFHQLFNCLEFNQMMEDLGESSTIDFDTDFQNASLLDLITIPPHVLQPGSQ